MVSHQAGPLGRKRVESSIGLMLGLFQPFIKPTLAGRACGPRPRQRRAEPSTVVVCRGSEHSDPGFWAPGASRQNQAPSTEAESRFTSSSWGRCEVLGLLAWSV